MDLHNELIEASRAERVSVNQLICAELARAIGRRGGSTDRDRGTGVAGANNARDEDPRWKAWDFR